MGLLTGTEIVARGSCWAKLAHVFTEPFYHLFAVILVLLDKSFLFLFSLSCWVVCWILLKLRRLARLEFFSHQYCLDCLPMTHLDSHFLTDEQEDFSFKGERFHWQGVILQMLREIEAPFLQHKAFFDLNTSLMEEFFYIFVVGVDLIERVFGSGSDIAPINCLCL